MAEKVTRQFYSIDDLVRMGVGSRSGVQRMVQDGTLPAVKLSSRRYIVPVDDFNRVIASHRDKTGA